MHSIHHEVLLSVKRNHFMLARRKSNRETYISGTGTSSHIDNEPGGNEPWGALAPPPMPKRPLKLKDWPAGAGPGAPLLTPWSMGLHWSNCWSDAEALPAAEFSAHAPPPIR
mmetsp:Transcript_53889/g.114496  ORF Transcript_53889/g.114496 Transcript_53889/m.114496 type:complete len:112 (-) Transcript_53889:1977-2312(-)